MQFFIQNILVFLALIFCVAGFIWEGYYGRLLGVSVLLVIIDLLAKASGAHL